MTGILLFLVAFLAMLAWFIYVSFKDPAGIFKPRSDDSGAAARPDDDPPV